ncbi:MAG TPA: helix-turn-helix domain-containing protein [Candidatus Polarisedimenticolia bacterium]|nr:helix-turn-helix domain-containing protein [Candidatus Polarisedimenticolia bacterium]
MIQPPPPDNVVDDIGAAVSIVEATVPPHKPVRADRMYAPAMRYMQWPPAARLAPFVRCFWTLESGRGPIEEEVQGEPGARPGRVFPDGCIEMIFHRGEPFAAQAADGSFIAQPAAMVVGQIDRALVLRAPARALTLGVSFHPAGAWPLLGAPARMLTGRAADPGDLWGRDGAGLARRVLSAGSAREAAALIETALLAGLSRAPSVRPGRRPDAALGWCLTRLAQTRGRTSIGELARATGRSRRALERAFAEQVGLAPKTFARIVRFQGVFERIRSRAGGALADVALDAGYYDQAHFTREFRRLTGLCPASYFPAEHDIARHFAARVASVQDAPAAAR